MLRIAGSVLVAAAVLVAVACAGRAILDRLATSPAPAGQPDTVATVYRSGRIYATACWTRPLGEPLVANGIVSDKPRGTYRDCRLGQVRVGR